MTENTLIAVWALCAFLVIEVYKRRSLMQLNWPERMDYYPFRRRVRAFIANSGFKISNSEHVVFDLELEVKGRPIFFICVPDNAAIVATKMVDWGEAKAYHGKGRQLVCITADAVHDAIKREASLRSFSFVHYKDLRLFLEI